MTVAALQLFESDLSVGASHLPGARRRPVVRHGRPAGRLHSCRRQAVTAQQYALRRLVVVSLALAALLLSGAAVAAAVGGGNPPAVPASHRQDPSSAYRVRQGDTMWSIAELVYGADNRMTNVQRLIDANGTVDLRVGQTLIIP